MTSHGVFYASPARATEICKHELNVRPSAINFLAPLHDCGHLRSRNETPPAKVEHGASSRERRARGETCLKVAVSAPDPVTDRAGGDEGLSA